MPGNGNAPFVPIDHIKRLVFGIRYQRHFRISDVTGQIVDLLAHSAKAPFPKGYFQQVLESPDRGRIVLSGDSSTKITINTDDLIFETSFNSEFDEKLRSMVEEIFPFMVENILKRYAVNDILRVGIVFGHDLSAPHFADKLTSQLTGSTVNSPESLILRFSKRLAVDESLVKKGVNDFRNMICMLGGEPPTKLKVDIDIQHYFDPPLERLDDFSFSNFFKDAKTLLINNYHPMLEKMFTSTDVHELAAIAK